MKIIKHLVDMIDDELCSAQEYAEKSIEYKVAGNQTWQQKFHKMAEDEISHAIAIHALAAEEIEKINKVYKAPEEMLKKWEEKHKKYVDKAAWIKQMLTL